jgi:DNA-binding PadR family transcriptional regulator
MRCVTLNNEDKILFVLYGHPEGLGYNELKLKIYEKSLRIYLPQFFKNGWVETKEANCRGGRKKLHFLTDSGKEEVKIRALRESAVDKAYEVWGVHSTREKLKIFSELVADLCLSHIDSKVFNQAFQDGLALAVKRKQIEVLNQYDHTIDLCKELLKKQQKSPRDKR